MTLKEILKDLGKINNNKVGTNRDDYIIRIVHGGMFHDNPPSAYVNDIEIDDRHRKINLLCE